MKPRLRPMEEILRQLLVAKLEHDQLRSKLAAFHCEREVGTTRPCWKATLVPPERDYEGRVELAGYWDHAGGNADDGDHVALWCVACRQREEARPSYQRAVYAFGVARTAFWNALRGLGRRSCWVEK